MVSFISRRGTLALLLLVAMSATATGQNGSSPDAATRSANALVRPGDRVVLHFLREPQMNTEVTVNERGQAPFPKLGMLSVAQLSIASLQDTLRARYSEYLRQPELEVAVLRRVVVNGEVKIPNVYMLDVASTVRDAIARAGGLTEMGNRGNVAIVRGGERFKVKDWELEAGAAADLQSGDQVIVGRKSWLSVNFLPVISTAVLVTSFVLQVIKN